MPYLYGLCILNNGMQDPEILATTTTTTKTKTKPFTAGKF
jgi:hypothetical protein